MAALVPGLVVLVSVLLGGCQGHDTSARPILSPTRPSVDACAVTDDEVSAALEVPARVSRENIGCDVSSLDDTLAVYVFQVGVITSCPTATSVVGGFCAISTFDSSVEQLRHLGRPRSLPFGVDAAIAVGADPDTGDPVAQGVVQVDTWLVQIEAGRGSASLDLSEDELARRVVALMRVLSVST